MATPSSGEGHGAFLTTFRNTARHKHRYEVFRDFVTLAACSLHNSVWQEPEREAEYLRIIGGYAPEDQQAFPKLLGILVELLEAEPRDVLGPLYMELEISSREQGQFFTPAPLSELMAKMTFWAELEKLEVQPFLTVQEPACGAGGMILALVKVMISEGHNPADRLWVQCIDVDRMAALVRRPRATRRRKCLQNQPRPRLSLLRPQRAPGSPPTRSTPSTGGARL